MSGSLMLAPSLAQLPTVAGTDDEFRIFTRPQFLPQIRFHAKAKQFGERGQIDAGNYGIPQASGEIIDLGYKIEVLPLARRMKAMDMTDLQRIISTTDTQSSEYRRIKEAFSKGIKGYMFGPSYLVVERDTVDMFEIFCGSKTMQEPANVILSACPMSVADCERNGRNPEDAHGPLPVQLASRKVVKPPYTWFVSTAKQLSTPFVNLPPEDVMMAEIQRFLTVTASAEAVDEESAPTRAI